MNAGSKTRDARNTLFGIATALMLAGFTVAAAPTVTPATETAPTAGTASIAPAEFEAWRIAFQSRAVASGLPSAFITRALDGLTPDPIVLQRLDNQAELVRPTGDYIARAARGDRIATGRELMTRHAALLKQLEQRYGVRRTILLAIWGIETSYGTNLGGHRTLRALATLAAHGGRRRAFGERQLLAALRILRNGDTDRAGLTGSWSGAMGHTQFIPTTYAAYAVDFDGDNRRDIWRSIPDALASTAHYLVKAGWIPGQPWGWEVRLGENFDYATSGLTQIRSLKTWTSLGVVRADADPLPDNATQAALLLPAGAAGPAFLVTRNFRAILRYNNAVPYALAVTHLADRIAGRGPFLQAWPTAIRPLLRAERIELQRRLAERGLDTGGIDGILGTKSRAAIRFFQQTVGLPADGFADAELLERLRQEAVKPAARHGETAL